MALPEFIHGLKSGLHARWCLAGVAAGLVLCSLAGRHVARLNYMEDFVRFDYHRSAAGYYFPTVSQMLAIVRSGCRENQVAVIVGGNSVFNGWGQPAEELWTQALQRRLGERFRVFNLALIGNENVPDGAALTAQIFAKEGREVIYVTSVMPVLQAGPLFHYMAWDAGYKGLVSKDLVEPLHRAKRHSGANEEELADRELGMRLDAMFYSQDLWNYAAYRYFFTAWTGGRHRWFAPKKAEPDYCIPLSPIDKRRIELAAAWEAYPPKERITKDLYTGARYEDMFETGREGGVWTARDEFWKRFSTQVQETFPQRFKPQVLMTFPSLNPWLLERLKPQVVEFQGLAKQEFTSRLKEAGYHVLDVSQFTPEDFVDSGHLSPPGGEKLAAEMEPKISQMAKELGFLKD